MNILIIYSIIFDDRNFLFEFEFLINYNFDDNDKIFIYIVDIIIIFIQIRNFIEVLITFFKRIKFDTIIQYSINKCY